MKLCVCRLNDFVSDGLMPQKYKMFNVLYAYNMQHLTTLQCIFTMYLPPMWVRCVHLHICIVNTSLMCSEQCEPMCKHAH